MALLAPYNASMKLGSGFNSYTQQLCVDHAVIRDEKAVSADIPLSSADGISQQVTYKTTMINKVSDITNALNISAAMSIKYDNKIDGTGQGDFVNSDKLKESTISFLISVRVVNQTLNDTRLTKFCPIDGIGPGDFTEVFGDCFISGYQDGGEFNALISIKKSDASNLHSFGVNAEIALTGILEGKLEGSAEGDVTKARKELLENNEVTISVSWKGGGQSLKEQDEDWTFETLRKAAVKFPDYVAKTPMRTHVVLTKYTALRSFLAYGTRYAPMIYENAGAYTTMLQEAFVDYKNLVKHIQTMSREFDEGKTLLKTCRDDELQGTDWCVHCIIIGWHVSIVNVINMIRAALFRKLIASGKASEEKRKAADNLEGPGTKPAALEEGETEEGETEEGKTGEASQPADPPGTEVRTEGTDSVVTQPEESVAQSEDQGDTERETAVAKRKQLFSKGSYGKRPEPREPFWIDQPYEATLVGLEKARRDIRLMMNRIVSEVDVVTHHPIVATDETWPMPLMSPILFKQYLPKAQPIEDS
ncbi:hypothetical protein F5Y18DRAFT_439342 [Xylariaceae sp. FL1019]|nr:hypothetical protein F5Y18DRAFT_439342 [Xylariaceae sp. FL1019]